MTDLRAEVVEHLRRQYLGPAGGDDEALIDRPDRFYLVGTLYPRGPASRREDGDVLGEDGRGDDLDEPIELANAWHPASAAISFLHTSPELICEVSAARYERRSEGDRLVWQRIPLKESRIVIDPDSTDVPSILGGAGRLVSVWRSVGSDQLVTVAVENTAVHDNAETPPPTENCLFQVHLSCHINDGEAKPYPAVASLSDDPEDKELQLLYRYRQVFGVGHGCSVSWEADGNGRVHTVSTEMLPQAVVPGISAGDRSAEVLRLSYLSDETVERATLISALKEFVDGYAEWVQTETDGIQLLDERFDGAPSRLASRMNRAVVRMRAGIDVLAEDDDVLVSFRLANAAMRRQMQQSSHIRDTPGVRGSALLPLDPDAMEPAWFPFQLAFQLLTLSSVAFADDVDRELVDLIWFPTGGGKTEAYLAMAAFEIIHRRLKRGTRGGGTAVITRYTLRMLTAQQFQRASALICALELMRRDHVRLQNTERFTIGLWVGGETTPNSYREAFTSYRDMRTALEPESPFQISNCPWCGTSLIPRRRSDEDGAYGFRSTQNSFEVHCTHPDCAFADALPVLVVDDQMFSEPPTLLVATVDKFARLAWSPDAGALFGRHQHYDAPSLVIQDELHLLSGPLGTTVALYEAAIFGLLTWDGKRPKVIASTATIRSASEQVRKLYGSEVALFPPSGLTAENSYFARTDHSLPGRLYIGLMPQAHTASRAAVLTSVALLEAPTTTGLNPAELDAYWTLVAYHNSLRELGRTVTAARDDVGGVLRRRAEGRTSARTLRSDGVIELRSNVTPGQLIKHMGRLARRVDQGDAVDLVATTNLLSVGIDISRLGLMLMNGQPKTTAEYIQATSRVGRSTVPGLVVTLLRANKPRDRSHYEAFRAYHESIYRYVEPTSVTPWSLPSRVRSLHAALVILVRHGGGLTANDDAGRFTADSRITAKAIEMIERAVNRAEPIDEELRQATADDLRRLAFEWDRRVREASELGLTLRYRSVDNDYPALLCDFGQRREGWPTANTMRSVDRQVRVIAFGEGI
ncbi:MAG: hypothetical protein K1X67_19635 [Fimbriimonadaceae bacterium]|nr:hypothetical protein [Fimbriimonadaceae bacterium]